MTLRKWESVKLKAQQEFSARVNQYNIGSASIWFYALLAASHDPACFGRKNIERTVDQWTEIGFNLIRDWDIRRCMKLFELFPSCLPQHLHGRTPTCEYDEKGNWVICFD